MTDRELTPEERRALDELPVERTPSDFLEERVVRSLRESGLLRRERLRALELTRSRVAAAVAACILLMVAGFAVGRWTSPSTAQGSPEPGALPARHADDFAVAAYRSDAGGPDSGQVFFYSGQDGSVLRTLVGEELDRLADAFVPLGDVTGDGVVRHRDVIERRGGHPFLATPIVQGHELAGEVVAVGEGVARFAPGDRVVNLYTDSCGVCDECLGGGVIEDRI